MEGNDLRKIFSGNFNGRIENAQWNVRIRLAVLLLLLLLLLLPPPINDTVMMEICDVLRALLQ